MNQVFSMVGAFLILWGFVGINYKWFDSESKKYHVINLFGALLLLVAAIQNFQIGFIVLQLVWAFVSLKKLMRLSRST